MNSKGVILMTAGDGESLVALAIGKDIKSVTVAAEKKGVTVKGEDLEKHRLHRARKGCQVQVKGPVRGIETGAAAIAEADARCSPSVAVASAGRRSDGPALAMTSSIQNNMSLESNYALYLIHAIVPDWRTNSSREAAAPA
ncbi:MAG: hypothetical protein ACK5TS_11410, partial [Betaproteobacteria bacterium]